jgi:NADH-quinone oxidoreductase subunit F
MQQGILLQNRRPDRPATLEEYRASGGYGPLAEALRDGSPGDLVAAIKDAGLRGRGGAGFPAGIKWSGVPADQPGPRYVVANTDEMEPGAFKDRVLVESDPHQVIEGITLAGYAVSARKGFFFVRASYEHVAALLENALEEARRAGFLGEDILGSGFSFDITVHRSAGRYICGESSAQINSLQGVRPNPSKGGPHLTEQGLWGRPTLLHNVETLACVPHIARHGADWFKGLAVSEEAEGTKLYTVSGRVTRPGCFELPNGTSLREIIFEAAGGMPRGCEFKACLPGGGSTSLLDESFLSAAMDYQSLKKLGYRMGTGTVVVFDRTTCLVGAVLNLTEFFARESCGWCTPCREGLPYIRELLARIEHGEGEPEYVDIIGEMAGQMRHSYCAFAPGAAAPIQGLLAHFRDEVEEHVRTGGCPFNAPAARSKPGVWGSSEQRPGGEP